MSIVARQKLERTIIRRCVRELSKEGFAPTMVRIGNAPDEDLPATTLAKVLEEVFSVDESVVYFKHPQCDHEPHIYIVLGNGEDCISDYSCEIQGFDQAMERTMEYINKLVD